MKEIIKLENVRLNQLKQVYKLYMEAFPKEERKPFFLLLVLLAKQLACIYTAADKQGEILGFFVVLFLNDLALVDYFAVNLAKRSEGYGSKMLQALTKKLPNHRIFLEIEEPNEEVENNSQRIRRKNFYLKNKWKESKVYVNIYGVDMELLYFTEKVSYQEYCQLLKMVLGEKIYQRIQVKLR